MGRGSPVCQQIREKIIEMFKNNVPQRKIGRDLDISPSTVHNIIKRFKESGGISVRKGQGCKPKLAPFKSWDSIAFSILSQLFLIWGCI